jgi:hypothetical protein
VVLLVVVGVPVIVAAELDALVPLKINGEGNAAEEPSKAMV